jgi:hypothetical protein
MLIAGVHNTLGRAAALSEQPTRAHQHFSAAIATGSPGTDARLFAQARTNQQLEQLGRLVEASRAAVGGSPAAVAGSGPRQLAIELLDRRDIGEPVVLCDGFPGPAVIFSAAGCQTLALLADARTLRLARRDLASGAVSTRDIGDDYRARPGGGSIGLGLDGRGHLHVCFDRGDGRLAERRSTEAHSIRQWSYALPVGGAEAGPVAQRVAIGARDGQPLTLLSQRLTGDAVVLGLKVWDEARQCWLDPAPPLLPDVEQGDDLVRWGPLTPGRDGCWLLAGFRRTPGADGGTEAPGAKLLVLRSADNGLTWSSIATPAANLPLAPADDGLQRMGLALDSADQAHLVFCSDDGPGRPVCRHLWPAQGRWRQRIVPGHTAPRILIDGADRVHLIGRDSGPEGRLRVTVLVAPDHLAGAETSACLADETGVVGLALDQGRWERENILSLLLYRELHPTPDREPGAQPGQLTALDLRLEFRPLA